MSKPCFRWTGHRAGAPGPEGRTIRRGARTKRDEPRDPLRRGRSRQGFDQESARRRPRACRVGSRPGLRPDRARRPAVVECERHLLPRGAPRPRGPHRHRACERCRPRTDRLRSFRSQRRSESVHDDPDALPGRAGRAARVARGGGLSRNGEFGVRHAAGGVPGRGVGSRLDPGRLESPIREIR